MHIKMIFSTLFVAAATFSFGRSNTLIVPEGVKMPRDTAAGAVLLHSLQSFLDLKDGPNEQNTCIAANSFLETSALLDEMKDIERNDKLHDSTFYKIYLQNIVPRDSVSFTVQLAAMGVHEGVPVLRAAYELIALRDGNVYRFSSPLRRNSAACRMAKAGRCSYHYSHDASQAVAVAYDSNAQLYDKKLLISNYETEIFFYDDLPEALKALGVLYKADYNGYAHNLLLARSPGKTLMVRAAAPADVFDPHDEWHERLRNAMPAAIVNRPVDEGCAYLYGGSWGFSWQEILAQFKTKVAADKTTDWLASYESFHNFADSGKPFLMTTYVINALIVQQLEREKGSKAVLELLRCGKYEKGNNNYFTALEKLTGINRVNFNERIWALVKRSS